MNKTIRNRGFTLLEMLLVIAIIAILAGIVIVAINPARQLGQANNAQRQSDVLAILNAVHQYSIDNSGDITGLYINEADDCGDAMDYGPDNAICINGFSSSECDGLSLEILVGSSVSPSYITDIPVDPLAPNSTEYTDLGLGGSDYSGYFIFTNPVGGRVTVCAPLAQNGETISVTR